MKEKNMEKGAIKDSGEARLAALGYKQELKRDFNLFTNTAISFSIISCISGVTSSYGIGWNNGGPATVVWGWVVVCFMTMFVGVAMGEIVSSLPSSGGPYFWSAHLSTKKYSPFAAWMTGWFNLLGQVAVTAGIDFALTNQIAAMWVLSNDYILTQGQLLAVYTVVLVIHALLNLLSTRILGWLNGFSVFWHVVGAIVMSIVIPVVAPVHQSSEFVWATFYSINDGPDANPNNEPSNAYIFLLGLLMAQFTITGFDASGHMSEETANADNTAPLGVVTAIASSAVVGFMYVLALTYSIQDPTTLTTGKANGYISGQIFYDAFYARYGNGTGAIVLMGIPMIALFLCGCSSVTSNSRMCWSFARDGGLPFSGTLSKVNKYTNTPVNAVVFMVTLAWLLGLPMLKSTVAFGAVISISTIGLYISYGIPIVVRLLNNKNFEPGPFYFGKVGLVIGYIGVAWVLVITAVFLMPTVYPVTVDNLNYAPVAVGVVLIGALASFFCPVIGARYWYRGEMHTVEDFTVHKKEAEAIAAAKATGLPYGRLNDDSAHSIPVAPKT